MDNSIKIELSQYIVEHSISEPSKMSDYDYDPTRPERRFVTTYIHHLSFADKITGVPVLALSFPSETCANIIASLYGMLLSKNAQGVVPAYDMQRAAPYTLANPIVLSIRNIFIEGKSIPSTGVITNINDHIRFTVASNGNTLCVSFTYDEADMLIKLLEIDEIVDMYVDYSDDRDRCVI